jgi:hypothetical protein
MRMRNCRTWLVAVLGVLLAGACSSQDPPPAPTPGPAARPVRIDKPIDLSSFRGRPCDAVPPDLSTRLQLSRKSQDISGRGNYPADGDQTSCTFSSQDRSSYLTVALNQQTRPVPDYQGRRIPLEPIMVGSYPAARWRIASNGSPTAGAVCWVLVGVSDHQGVLINYGANPEAHIKDVCPMAEQVANAVIAQLTG